MTGNNTLKKVEDSGRIFETLEDGSSRIILSRRDFIEIAMQIYDEYFMSEKDKIESFGDYLAEELAKEENDSTK